VADDDGYQKSREATRALSAKAKKQKVESQKNFFE
jgi:hypothetical protein